MTEETGEDKHSTVYSNKKEDNKVCGVCGDKAFGYNFNAVTCESCKAFFRRNALKRKVFKCPFDGKCTIGVMTRRFCQKCRLNKCIEIGMKKEWILSDEERIIKRAKIEENRQKKSRCDSLLSDTDINDDATRDSLFSHDTNANKLQARIESTCQQPNNCAIDDNNCNVNGSNSAIIDESDNTQSNNSGESVDSKIQLSVKNMEQGNVPMMVTVLAMSAPNIMVSSSGLVYQTGAVIQENVQNEAGDMGYVTSPIDKTLFNSLNCLKSLKQSGKREENKVIKSVLQIAIETEFSKIPIRDSNVNFKELSRAEHSKLDELIVANEILKMPLMFGVPDPSLLDVINMTDHAIRRLIKMSKKINGFKALCQDDQIALLKGSCTELMILRSVMSYDPEKDCWNGPQGPKSMSIKVDILKEAKGNVYEEHKRFINSFDPIWRTDENIMLILSAIALFTPERPNVVHKDKVKMEQNTYYYLLRRYLETVYSGCEARSIYLKLIKKLQELHILNENHVRVFLDVDPKDVEPLLIEIFDLKH